MVGMGPLFILSCDRIPVMVNEPEGCCEFVRRVGRKDSDKDGEYGRFPGKLIVK
jgi:hypothetical protein